MAENFLTQLLPETSESEFKYLNWILQNTHEVYLIPEKYFFNKNSKLIIKAIKSILEKNLSVTDDEIYYFCGQADSEFDLKVIENIRKKSTENIKFIKDILKENYLKYNTITKLQSLIINATSKQNISFEVLEENINDIYSSLHNMNNISIQTSDELTDNYEKILEERKAGLVVRSLGYKPLDKMVVRKAAPGEMTGIVGMKGGAKTTFTKNIENKLLYQKIPVVSINLENTEESCYDKSLALRMNIKLEQLMDLKENPRLEAKVHNELKYYRDIKNLLFYSQPTLSLDEFDSLLYKSKNIFRKRGVIVDDDYMLVTIDLLDMIDEFSNSQNSYNIKTAINKLHQIVRKHNVHAILLLQSNENKLRQGKVFKNSDDLDYYKIGLEDIEGSAAIAQRCRVVMTLTRPVQMKKRFFPEEMERWNLETDLINCNIVKQNDGNEGFTQFVLTPTFRIYPYINNDNKDDY